MTGDFAHDGVAATKQAPSLLRPAGATLRPCHPCNPWSKNLCPKTLCDVLENDLRSPPNHGAARHRDATFDAVFLARARVNREQINFILAGAREIRQRGPARSTR